LRLAGARESRPALSRLIADAHRRLFAVLLVPKVDGFGAAAEASFLCDMSFIVYRLLLRSLRTVQLLYNFSNDRKVFCC
jgi:DNA invertase Pin-like site-specific DNA recombinase